MKKLSYKTLYIAWAVMFALTAVLGFLFPAAQNGWAKFGLGMIAVLFFLPPWAIVIKAKKENARFHSRLVGILAASSLAWTLALLVLNLLSVTWSESLGNALYAALVIVSSPMVCSNLYVLPLFLWGTLLTGAFSKK